MFQFRRFPAYCYFIHSTLTRYCRAGFPHSDIHGSRDICSSPWLFAACRVLHRLLMPRHSPCALISLTFVVAKSARLRFRRQPPASAENCARSLAPPLKSETRYRFVREKVAAQPYLATSLWSHSCSQNYAGFTEVLRSLLRYPKSSTLRLLAAPSRGALCCLAFLRLPLFSFQGAEMRVTRQVFSPETVAVNECTL